MENPYDLLSLCAVGFISRSGRTRAFDASADGYTQGEGVVALLVSGQEELEKKDLRALEGMDLEGFRGIFDGQMADVVGFSMVFDMI